MLEREHKAAGAGEGTANRTYEFVATAAADTQRLAVTLAELAAPDMVLALDGDLGAGKTTFSQMMARALGVTETVNSPTFTIIKEYEGTKWPVFHMDVYRLGEDDGQASALGLDEYFFGGGVTLVEWAGLIAELLPDDLLHMSIYVTHVDGAVETGRRFVLEPHGVRYETLCESLVARGLIREMQRRNLDWNGL